DGRLAGAALEVDGRHDGLRQFGLEHRPIPALRPLAACGAGSPGHRLCTGHVTMAGWNGPAAAKTPASAFGRHGTAANTDRSALFSDSPYANHRTRKAVRLRVSPSCDFSRHQIDCESSSKAYRSGGIQAMYAGCTLRDCVPPVAPPSPPCR